MKIFSTSKIPGHTNTANAITSVIGKDMTIVGDLSFKSKIQIDGHLHGNLCGTCLILSESGRIIGDIETDCLICYGQIDGNLKVGKLFLKKTGVINGRVETSDLSVESGGSLNGEISAQRQGDGGSESALTMTAANASGWTIPTLATHDQPDQRDA